MTPPCPSCGTVFADHRSVAWRNRPVSIDSFWLNVAQAGAGDAFLGHEYRCNKCLHRWRVPATRTPNAPC